LVLLAVAAAVVAADQGTKSWAEQALASGPRHVVGPVNLVLTFNRGAAFSLGSGVTPLIEALAVVLVALVLWQSGRLARGGAGWAYVTGFGLLSGGALSNLADRLFRHHHGAVVDFIQLVSWWPVFNVADACLTLGAVVVAVNAVFFYRPSRAESRTEDAGGASEGGQGADLADLHERGQGS
jgi:signal peptidase II